MLKANTDEVEAVMNGMFGMCKIRLSGELKQSF